jgi:hypothetical protein
VVTLEDQPASGARGAKGGMEKYFSGSLGPQTLKPLIQTNALRRGCSRALSETFICGKCLCLLRFLVLIFSKGTNPLEAKWQLR